MADNREYICEELQDLLKQISMALSYTLSNVLEDSALTFHQVYIMKVIGGNTNINLTALCKELNLTKGAMSLTLNKLEEEGYVKRCENPLDRRNRNIVITPKGEEILKNTREKLIAAFGMLTNDLTLEELENMKNSLMRLNEAISKGMKHLENELNFNSQ